MRSLCRRRPHDALAGPVLSLLRFSTGEEVEAIANSTPYPLCDLPFGGMGIRAFGWEGGPVGLVELLDPKAVHVA